ncbi:MAG: hypothetical protein WA667_03710 [Candidatus Nitrosopolaris sp.]
MQKLLAGIDLKLVRDEWNGLIKQAYKYKKTGGKIRIWLLVHSTSVLKRLYILNLVGIIMHNKTSFLITGAILIAAVVTVALYNVNIANAQSVNMTNSTTGANMTKTMNMTAGGGNMTKTMNMTAGGGNMTKTMNMTGVGNMTNSTHQKTKQVKRLPGL